MATIAMPTSPKFASVRPVYRHSTKMSVSQYNFTQQVYSWRGRLKVVEFTLPPMEQAEATEWITFFRALNGFENVFEVDLSEAYPNETGITEVEMRLTDPDTGWSLVPPLRYEFSFTAMEAL